MVAWYVVWLELIFFSVLITFLIVPVPLGLKNLFVKGLDALFKSYYFKAFFAANLCVLLFQFGDSYNQMLKYQANKDALGSGMTTGAGSLGEKIDINMKLFRAQRNIYLSFFCLFEVLILCGLCKLTSDLHKITKEKSAKAAEAKKGAVPMAKSPTDEKIAGTGDFDYSKKASVPMAKSPVQMAKAP